MASCRECGNFFIPKTKRGVFCKPSCRVAYNRKQKRVQREAEKNTMPMELASIFNDWRDIDDKIPQMLVDLYKHRDHPLLMISMACTIAFKAYEAGRRSAIVTRKSVTLKSDKTE